MQRSWISAPFLLQRRESNMGEQHSCCSQNHRIGGQALIEGVLMLSPTKRALAVRNPEGEIVVEQLPASKPTWGENIPLVRGSIRLVKQMAVGMRAMTRSATIAGGEDTSADNGGWLVLFSALVAIVIFVLLPNTLLGYFGTKLGLTQSVGGKIALNFVEGILRIAIFLLYIYLATRLSDIKRVWMYHGAEHMTIACNEHNLPLEVENVKKFSRLHPRCGTAFLCLVMVISILVISLTGWGTWYYNLIWRLLLLPVIAGISYELITWAGRKQNWFTRLISAPGLWLQLLTTAEPTSDMIEVAIAALKAVR